MRCNELYKQKTNTTGKRQDTGRLAPLGGDNSRVPTVTAFEHDLL